ncbi:MAG: hypothetical protein JO206_15670 [Solirubrobacterales bacterium]|nr:hypothetical protein [Solirubrobacterales bacterium]
MRTRLLHLFGSLTVALAAGTSSATAHPHGPPCSLSAGKLAPQIISPCNGAGVAQGQRLTFEVRDLNPNAPALAPYLYLTSKAPHHGRLSWSPSVFVVYDTMQPIHGHPGLFQDRPLLLTYPGWFLITPGRYYVQAMQIDESVPGGFRYSRVQTVVVR